MFNMGKATLAAAAMGAMIAATPATAGSNTGDFMVRVQGTYVDFNDDASGLPIELDNEFIPTATLTYFFNNNLAVELFCCFAKLEAEGTRGPIDGVDLGDFWVFPPALTLQYHFDNFGGFKPYVGAGVQYIHFFSEGRSDLPGNPKIDLDDAVGFTLQAGVDISLGDGWYLNADIKKTWIETDASWSGVTTADVDVDPWIYSVGLGYRFNLEDVFGARQPATALK